MQDPSAILKLLVQIAVILALSRVVGWLFGLIRQPQVMGEMLAGILLGPSLMGWAWPGAYGWLFPPDKVQNLYNLSQVGIVFYLFLVGLDLDPNLIRSRGKSAVGVSITSIALPFALGVAVATIFYERLFGDAHRHHYVASVLFMGAAMSITAFPVLARILTERNLHKSRVGALSIACAAVNDVAAWCILAFVVAVARHYAGPTQALWTAGLAGAYVIFMLLAMRPLLRRFEAAYERSSRLSPSAVALVFLLVLASSMSTELIGIHALFGAFLLGFVMPKGSRFVRHLSEKLEDFVVVLLLPLFFAYTGLNTRIGLLNSVSLWGFAALIIAVACAGKFGGATIAARLLGTSWREASAIGILMNTRGLIELVILNIGHDLHVISSEVFAMMIMMALATTLLTTPALHWLYPARFLAGAVQAGKRAFSVLIPLSLPKSGGPLVQIADALIGPIEMTADSASQQPRIVAVHLRPPVDHEAYRSGLDDEQTKEDSALEPLLAQARSRKLPVESLSYVSADVAADIAALAAAKHVDLVLMGFHKPVFGRMVLGGVVHRVLSHCPTDVAIFVDRDFRAIGKILVPYLGSTHDRLALELAGRIARNTSAKVTVLHVVPPMPEKKLDAKAAVDRVFQDPATSTPVTFKVVEDISPVGVVLHEAQQFDLVVIGISEAWELESHLFGWRPQRIAQDCPCSLLIVKRGPELSHESVAPIEDTHVKIVSPSRPDLAGPAYQQS